MSLTDESSTPGPLVVVVAGAPGSGKTTLARHLATALTLPLFTKDTIKETLFDTLGWGDRAWSRKLGTAAVAILFGCVEAELAAGRSFIVESNFQPAHAAADFHALRARYPFQPCVVYCHAEEEVLLARFAARAHSADRHPGHVDQQNYDHVAATIHDGTYGPPDIGGTVITVDTTDFTRIDYPALLAAIRATG
jgi:predicted kinase